MSRGRFAFSPVALAVIVLPNLAFIALLAVTLAKSERASELLTGASYYIMFGIFVAWVACSSIYLGETGFSLKKFLSKYRIGLLTALVITCAVFISVKPEFGILEEDMELLSISKSMLYGKTADNGIMGNNRFDNFYPIDSVPPSRPLFFPFLTYIFHTLLGFNPANTFALNFMALFCLLSSAYIFARRYMDEYGSVAAVVFIVSFPAVSIMATSGGYDIFSTLMFFIVLVTLFTFMKKPSPESFSLLWVNLLVFSNIRSESILYFFLIIVALAALRYITMELVKGAIYPIAFTPLLLLPLFWLNASERGEQVGAGIENISSLFAGIVIIAALLILLYFVYALLSKRIIFQQGYKKHFLLIFFAGLLLNMALLFSYLTGGSTEPHKARLFLVFCIASAMSPVLLKALKQGAISGKVLLIVSSFMLMLYHPAAIEGRSLEDSQADKKGRVVAKYFEDINDKNGVVIDNMPGYLTARDYGGFDFGYANREMEFIITMLSRHFITDIYVVQRFDNSTRKMLKEDSLNPVYELETLSGKRYSDKRYIRISRVVKEPTVNNMAGFLSRKLSTRHGTGNNGGIPTGR